MQTFLPYENYQQSAKALDRLRLGKQRVETLQLLRAINGETKGWQNHPAAHMWTGHENSLVLYGVAMCDEWKRRGYKDTCEEKIFAYFKPGISVEPPAWLGDQRFHSAHRSNLLRKDPEYYSKFGWEESPDLPYVWP